MEGSTNPQGERRNGRDGLTRHQTGPNKLEDLDPATGLRGFEPTGNLQSLFQFIQHPSDAECEWTRILEMDVLC